MKIRFSPQPSPAAKIPFQAKHPVFRYEVPATPAPIAKLLSEHEEIVVAGMGGSILPLKALRDLAGLSEKITLLDTVDPDRMESLRRLKKPLFCVVSKSGETLEIQTLMRAIESQFPKAPLLVVTDPLKGSLRAWATEKKWPTLEIPPEIGGRFTHFTPLHRALFERFGLPFSRWLEVAREETEKYRQDSAMLESLSEHLFGESPRMGLVLWAYGDAQLGLAQWIQQGLAESLGKRSRNGKRVGFMPTVLQGPQDQHSVLQLLMEGPQDKAHWFLRPKPGLRSDFLAKALDILSEATLRSFEERTVQSDTLQPVVDFPIENRMEDGVRIIVLVHAFIEYAAEKLLINAFDQPGVERGKQIARELLGKDS